MTSRTSSILTWRAIRILRWQICCQHVFQQQHSVALSLCATDFHRPSGLGYLFTSGLLTHFLIDDIISSYIYTSTNQMLLYAFNSVSVLLSASVSFQYLPQQAPEPSIRFWALPASSPTFLVVTGDFSRIQDFYYKSPPIPLVGP